MGSEWNLVCAAFNVKKLAAPLGTRGHPANPGPAAEDEGGNGPFRKLPALTPFVAGRGGLLGRLTPRVRPRAISVAPLTRGV